MIDKNNCVICKVNFEVYWDDRENLYWEGVEDSDDDINDMEVDLELEFCPFCGTSKFFDDDDPGTVDLMGKGLLPD